MAKQDLSKYLLLGLVAYTFSGFGYMIFNSNALNTANQKPKQGNK